MNKKISKIIEIVWLVLTIATFLAGIHKTYQLGFLKSYPFFIISFVAFIMYNFRKNLRLKAENKDQSNQSEK